jgi:hypothetical protein
MMKAKNYEKQAYIKSPLASLLTQIIKKIGELKNSYSEAPADTLKQLDAMAAYLKVLHGSILPYFDNETPGYIGLASLYLEYGKLKDITKSLNDVPTQTLATPKLILFKEIILAAFSNYVSDFMANGKFNKELLSNKVINSILDFEQDRIIFQAAKFAETDEEILKAEFNTIKQTLLNLNLSTINFSGDIGQIISVVLELTGCFTNPELSAAFNISHPVFLELFVFLANQLETLPKELKLLVSFLKPETIPELISSLPGSTLSITHQGNYNYTVESKEKRTFDLPLIYSALHTLPRQIIIPAVITYMKQDSDKLFKLTVLHRLFPISDLQKTVKAYMTQDWVFQKIKDKELIPTFLNKVLPASALVQNEISQAQALNEKKLEYVEVHQKSCILQIDSQLSGLAAIKNIDQLIQDNARLLKENNELQNYLENDSSLKEPCKLSWNAEHKIIESLPFGETINPLITGNKKQTKVINELLCNQERQFPFVRLNAVHKWIEEVQGSYSKGLAGYQLELSSILQDDLEVIPKSKTKKFAKQRIANDELNTNPIETLEKYIECLSTKILKLNKLQTQCIEWSKNYIPSILDEVSGDKSLEDALIELSEQLSVDTHSVLEDMQVEMLMLNQEIAKAKKDLSALLFAEKMHSANPEQMKQTIADKENEYNNLGIKINTLEAQLNKTNEAIMVTCSQMEELNANRSKQEAGISQVVYDTNLLINESYGISKQYQSTNQPPSISIEPCLPKDFINWTGKEILFLKALFEQYDVESVRDLKPYNDNLQLLLAIEQTFKNSLNDTTIPFKALEALIKTSDDNRLFILLDFEKSLTYWNDYRYDQDGFFSIAPSEKERNTARQLLSRAIVDKICEVQKDIETMQTSQAKKQREITSSLEILSENKELFIQKNAEKIKLEEGVLSTKTSFDEFDKTNQQHAEDKQTQSEAISVLRKEQQSLKDTASILNLMIAIFDGITAHGELITSFCTGDALFNLENSIQPIEQSRNALLEKVSLFYRGLDKLDSHEKSSYQPKLDQIQTLLANCDDSIKTTMQSRYETTCIKPIPGYQIVYDELYKKYLNLIENPNTISIEQLMTQYDGLSKLMKVHQANLLSAKQVLTQDMNKMVFTPLDAFCGQEQQDTQQSLAKLNTELSLLGANIEDHTFMLHIDEHTINVKSEGDNALIFTPNVAYPEIEEQHLINTTLLQEVKINYDDFNIRVQNPENLEALKEKIRIYNEARTEASNKLEASLVTNDALAQRIGDRKLLVDKEVETLTTYLSKRNEQVYFKDKVMRTQFITDLQLKLNAYKDSGNSKEVLDHIRAKRKQLTGGELEQILNQLTVKIMDSDDKIPTSYVLSEEDEISLDAQAVKVLLKFVDNPDYNQRIIGLHEQVTAMRDFGNSLNVTDPCRQIAIDLANKLDEDIHRFVIKHPVVAPDANAYARFQDKFTARSHSKDNDMEPYCSTWLAILANIAIGVASLGIALGIKAITSYVKTGESFLFFRQSDMQEKVGEINKLAKEILSAPAVA